MKKLKKNEGITLIALVITTIVMIILVGVTVNVALNGGLFNKAKEATVKTNRAIEEEKEMEIALEIEMRREELLERYPVGEPILYHITDAGMYLSNTNIIDLFEYIIGEYYESTWDNLTLKTAIKAGDKVFQLYNPEVKDYVYYYNHSTPPSIETYWEDLSESEGYDFSKYEETGNIESYSFDQETKLKLETIQFAVIIGNHDKIIGLKLDDYGLFAKKGNNEYCLEVTEILEDLDDYYYNDLPMKYLELGESEMDFSLLINRKLEIIEVDTNNINSFVLLVGNNEDSMGKMLLVTDAVDDTTGKKIAFPMHNIILIDTKLGGIYYVDDNSNSDRPIP